jgi:hypothetical protein
MRNLSTAIFATVTAFAASTPFATQPASAAGGMALGTFRGMQPTLTVTVAGHEEPFLLDTGGGITIISPTLAKAVHCEPWGNVVGFRMTGERLDLPHCDQVPILLQRTHYRIPAAVVFDIMLLAGKDPPPLAGSLALDAFADQAITIEPVAHRLVIETAASLAIRTRQASEVPIRLVRDAQGLALSVVVGVPTPKGLAWMELDTGNDDSAIVVSRSIAPLLGVDPGAQAPQPIRAVLASGIVLTGNVKVVAGLIMDGNIGIQFLRAWNITLDLKHGRAWFAPASH